MSSKAATHNQTKHWQALDAAHHIHPFTETRALNNKGVRVITKADGIYVWDSEGNRLIDGMSGLWCVNVGYGRTELARGRLRGDEAAALLQSRSSRRRTRYATELAAKIASLLPAGLNRILFANSGSEANDTALKLIRYYWNLQGKTQKKIHISREYAYHGVTMAAASLSGLTPMHPQFDLPLAGFEKVPTAYWYMFGERQRPECVWAGGRAQAGGENSGTWGGPGGFVLGRAYPRRGWVAVPAGQLLAGDPAHLQEVRRAAASR